MRNEQKRQQRRERRGVGQKEVYGMSIEQKKVKKKKCIQQKSIYVVINWLS